MLLQRCLRSAKSTRCLLTKTLATDKSNETAPNTPTFSRKQVCLKHDFIMNMFSTLNFRPLDAKCLPLVVVNYRYFFQWIITFELKPVQRALNYKYSTLYMGVHKPINFPFHDIPGSISEKIIYSNMKYCIQCKCVQ